MLDLLIYTDATADESLTGSPGFQFVAHSAGATRVDEGIVREQLQHSVPENVLADNWEQHPATCAYIRVEGRMYLSRGLSTGATLGGRPGNQLTVTLMTSDPYEIIPLVLLSFIRRLFGVLIVQRERIFLVGQLRWKLVRILMSLDSTIWSSTTPGPRIFCLGF